MSNTVNLLESVVEWYSLWSLGLLIMCCVDVVEVLAVADVDVSTNVIRNKTGFNTVSLAKIS